MSALRTALRQASIYDVQYKHKAGFSASMDTISLSCLIAPSWTAIRRRHGLIRFVMPCDIRNVHVGSAVLNGRALSLRQPALKLFASNHAMQ